MDLRAQVANAIDQHRLLRRNERVVVAVSGGVDSMVLLHLLHGLAADRHWHLTIAHLNHTLRGRSSDADERFVRRAAEKKGLPFISERAQVRALAAGHGLSVEMAARQLRHEFLARAAKAAGARRIALAHHRDDQVELFFIRLLRGAGMDGLAGMKWSNPSPAARRIVLIRPLLAAARADICSFAKEQGIAFREDASNKSLDMLRNRVRHELLPLLEKQYQPALRSIITRLMGLLAAESELAHTLAHDLASGPVDFDKLPVAAQRRLLQLQLVRLGLRFDYKTVEQLRQQRDTPLALGPNVSVYRDGAGGVHSKSLERSAFNEERQSVDLSGSGRAFFDGVTFAWQIRPVGQEWRPDGTAGRELFDADRVGKRVTLRHWRPGDRYRPIGGPGSVKLQDFFANAKIPRTRRHQLVVATTENGEIFWVEGLRISEMFKLDGTTRRRLEWSWRRG